MRVYLREFFAEFRAFVYWTIGICVLLIFFMAFRPLLAESEEFFSVYMQSMPPEFALAFGIDIETMFEPIGYYVFVSNFVLLAGVIMSCGIALSIFSREKRASTTDFLFTKPVSRLYLFLTKLAAGVTMLVLFATAYHVTLYIVYTDEVTSMVHTNLTLAYFMTQLIFFGIGVLLSMLLRRVRSVSGLATVVGFVGYIMTMMNNTLGISLRFFSPMQYFNIGYMAQNGIFEIGYVLLAILMSVLLIGGAGYIYCTKDVTE